ncbi:FAD-binding oxidoreductase [Dietzia sp. PP-33]|uniref:FAD-binding oxidoreductase n=1 Tax=Dietzia sp. PP-33 TaxID=2957500 RepID=UPI0029A19145|nr:FAD-binding oxidoreductase [Dietzia sp. PP-33]MDX2358744.1 FAD-binding oxidoreductase [Dietzia sp. PP-33]
MTTVAEPQSDYLEDFKDVVGADQVLEGRKISRYLRDFSWYSPILENALADTTVDAVIRPGSVEELTAVVALAARNQVPITLRGSGTGNYGQSLPLEQGIVVDIKGVAGILELEEGRVSVLPGTVIKNIESAANAAGQELAVMPSTYRVATASGFISGGSGGLGAAAHGDLWSNNILAVELITVEETPRTIRLEGDDVNLVLHMYGTVGVLTRIEMRLVPMRTYAADIVVFDDFEQCCRFGWDLVASDVHTRLASLQQAPIGAMMTPIAAQIPDGAHVALVWSDVEHADAMASLAGHYGGTVTPWPEGTKHITQFPYSHTILWSRKAVPDSSWLQCEYAAGDRERFIEQVRAVSERYAGVFLQHIEINTSPSGDVRCMGIPPLVDLPDHEAALDELIAYCTGLGISLLNPHSFVVEEGGFVGDTGRMLDLKRDVDPLGILNPGKLGKSFFSARDATVVAADRDMRAPEQLARD